jgi:hypothetical protein
MNHYLKISMLAVIICGLVFHETKPHFFYNKEGDFRCFGLNNHETIIPLWLALTIIGLFVYNAQILTEGKYIV